MIEASLFNLQPSYLHKYETSLDPVCTSMFCMSDSILMEIFKSVDKHQGGAEWRPINIYTISIIVYYYKGVHCNFRGMYLPKYSFAEDGTCCKMILGSISTTMQQIEVLRSVEVASVDVSSTIRTSIIIL